MPRYVGSPPSEPTPSSASGSAFETAPMIDGLGLRMDGTAAGVTSQRLLTVLSSAVHGGGIQSARAIITLHVARHAACCNPAPVMEPSARRAAVPVASAGL